MQAREPEVLPDGRVTFRLRAPRAAEVIIAGEWPKGRAPMTKGADGNWSITVGPLQPDVWEYSFEVDGLAMIDPRNPAVKPTRTPDRSFVYIPGVPPLLHDFQDVPHGMVRYHTYFSKSVGQRRDLVVYTPPGYDQHPEISYPTLYLLHGSGDTPASWTVMGKAHWTMDNLIAQGRAKPMVIVMPDGHAGSGRDSRGLFERDLLEDVMPLVESSYRVKTDPTSRAITGASMGGEQALTIGLNHLDLFAWIGGFSAVAPRQEAIASAVANPDATNQKVKLLWIACGKEDFLIKGNEAFITLLKDTGLHHEWHLMELGHGWVPWRKTYLSEFAMKLF
jgi:enterochelin esterase-like enzyme